MLLKLWMFLKYNSIFIENNSEENTLNIKEGRVSKKLIL